MIRIHRETGSGNIATTVAPGINWQIEGVRLHLSAAGGANDLSVAVNSNAGAAYDVALLEEDMTSVVDLVWKPERPIEFVSGDEVDIAWINASSRTYGLEIAFKGI